MSVIPFLPPGYALQNGDDLNNLFGLVVPVQRAVRNAQQSLIQPSDLILNLNLPGPATLQLPRSATRAGKPLIFVDAAFSFATNPVTLQPFGTETIVNSSTPTSLVMNTNGQGVCLSPFSDGVNNGWFITALVQSGGGGGGSGNVVGPASSTTGHLAVFADTTGKLLSDGGAPSGGGGSVIGSRGTLAGFGSLGALSRSGSLSGGNLVAPLYIMSELGVVGDGSTDDTAALNAAFALAAGDVTGATFICDGFYKTSDTITVGSNTGGNLTGPTSFINVLFTGGGGTTTFKYFGPNDGRPVVRFCVNKHFYVNGLSIQNFTTLNTGLRGTSIGLQLGGDGGTVDAGTACLAATFENCNISNCHTGIQDGNFGDSSEITWINLTLSGFDTGWTSIGFNTLDHIFICPSLSTGGIGFDSGAAEGFHVYGGSASDITTACFNVQGNGICDVTGFRIENSVALAVGQGGSMTLRNCSALANCLISNLNAPDPNATVVTGNFDRLIIDSCNVTNGWLQVTGAGAKFISITNSKTQIDTVTNLPFQYLGSAGGGHIHLKNNENITFQAPQPFDFDGFVSQVFIDANPQQQTLLTPQTMKVPQNFLAANTGQTLGTDYLSLSHVRQLAEGPTSGLLTVTTLGTAVTNAVTTANNVLHFAAASLPAGVQAGTVVIDTTNPGALFDGVVASVTSTTVTLFANVTVASGDTITFYNPSSTATPGQNLRVSGTFATSATLTLNFVRNFTVTGPGFPSETLISSGLFLPTDAGKPIKIAANGNNGWTDWFGYGYSFTDASHLKARPAGGQQAQNAGAGKTATIGQNEPDANYIVASIVGNAASPESYSVTAQTNTGFTLKSSNASSTATVTCLIVR